MVKFKSSGKSTSDKGWNPMKNVQKFKWPIAHVSFYPREKKISTGSYPAGVHRFSKRYDFTWSRCRFLADSKRDRLLLE